MSLKLETMSFLIRGNYRCLYKSMTRPWLIRMWDRSLSLKRSMRMHTDWTCQLSGRYILQVTGIVVQEGHIVTSAHVVGVVCPLAYALVSPQRFGRVFEHDPLVVCHAEGGD